MKYFYIIIIIIGLLVIFLVKDHNKSDYSNNVIDSLQNEIEKLENKKDSIDLRIDTVTNIIKITETKYEKVWNDVITNTIDSNYVFFSRYIGENSKRLDSISNK